MISRIINERIIPLNMSVKAAFSAVGGLAIGIPALQKNLHVIIESENILMGDCVQALDNKIEGGFAGLEEMLRNSRSLPGQSYILDKLKSVKSALKTCGGDLFLVKKYNSVHWTEEPILRDKKDYFVLEDWLIFGYPKDAERERIINGLNSKWEKPRLTAENDRGLKAKIGRLFSMIDNLFEESVRGINNHPDYKEEDKNKIKSDLEIKRGSQHVEINQLETEWKEYLCFGIDGAVGAYSGLKSRVESLLKNMSLPFSTAKVDAEKERAAIEANRASKSLSSGEKINVCAEVSKRIEEIKNILNRENIRLPLIRHGLEIGKLRPGTKWILAEEVYTGKKTGPNNYIFHLILDYPKDGNPTFLVSDSGQKFAVGFKNEQQLNSLRGETFIRMPSSEGETDVPLEEVLKKSNYFMHFNEVPAWAAFMDSKRVKPELFPEYMKTGLDLGVCGSIIISGNDFEVIPTDIVKVTYIENQYKSYSGYRLYYNYDSEKGNLITFENSAEISYAVLPSDEPPTLEVTEVESSLIKNIPFLRFNNSGKGAIFIPRNNVDLEKLPQIIADLTEFRNSRFERGEGRSRTRYEESQKVWKRMLSKYFIIEDFDDYQKEWVKNSQYE